MTRGAPTVDPTRFRSVLGHFCTGVAVVTAHDGDAPVGFACQSFAALSLEPPLVLFCPAKSSRTWPVIEGVGRFAVNVLSGDQRDVSATFGARGADKFAAVDWSPAPSGAPVLTGSLTWIDCTIEAVHEAGDHYVVVGRVTELGDVADGRPLLFYRGRYTVTEPEAVEEMFTWPRPDDWF
ncbi:3-hydroxy-9,10-secoandrosta-1,3,5(10)-triene-9,17-dione monooxygenase reductase subunit [Saccharomonospora iraqiensis]|uniref:3-hydroxy-9,10-secoandrosta-1,3,5(10)-triene-9, 17-dione monooxygenase reductase subunit n=1 Tax=Saccharomonospora iraqiensis TaxID=52698 RepID=UPI00022E24E5|nr:3-hydroxy-9,10-secoandrosta-1,3,5(10)-triene-9,17-dione monooxygenase reductase subunit [Saccharomonospora iraqiensis]